MPGSTIESLKNKTGTDLASAIAPPKFSQIDSTLRCARLFPVRSQRKAGSLPLGGDGRLPGCGWSLRGVLCAKHPLNIRFHLLQLLSPVAPAVRALRRGDVHRAGGTRRDVVVPDSLLGAPSEP